jgi:predicted methyltransferase
VSLEVAGLSALSVPITNVQALKLFLSRGMAKGESKRSRLIYILTLSHAVKSYVKPGTLQTDLFAL